MSPSIFALLTLFLIFAHSSTAHPVLDTADTIAITLREGSQGSRCTASDATCEAPTECRNVFLQECSADDELCICTPDLQTLVTCDDDDECEAEHVCVEDTCLPKAWLELFQDTVTDIIEEETGVCVDATALGAFERDELVFEKHPVTSVLCDPYGSCATPGHVVLFEGVGMMMKSYCETVACVRKVIEVNSPKYRRGMRVQSKTPGLQYSALAAKWESWGEENFMRAAVRMGF